MMQDYLWLWSELLIRWVHVIAGIAWIGSSFYFIALDLSLKPGRELPIRHMVRPGRCMAGAFTIWSNIWSPPPKCRKS
jgi:uncharacterized membrane protein